MSQTEPSPTTNAAESRAVLMDTVIGYVLLGGVLVSVALLVAGLIWHWIKTGQVGVKFKIVRLNLFEFVAAELRGIGNDFRPRLLVGLGIAALLLTPYLRVAASLAFFALVERNWKYSLFTGFVLAVLTYSLFLR